MRPKKTWTVKAWSTGGWVEPLPAIRAQYGDDVASVVENFAEICKCARDGPSAQDVKHTLRSISSEADGLAAALPASITGEGGSRQLVKIRAEQTGVQRAIIEARMESIETRDREKSIRHLRDASEALRGLQIETDEDPIARRLDAFCESLRHLDGTTDACMVSAAWKLHRTWEFGRLTLSQIAEVARAALASLRASSGRSPVEALGVRMVRGLLPHCAHWEKQARDELISVALRACGLGHSPKRIEAALSAARNTEKHAG